MPSGLIHESAATLVTPVKTPGSSAAVAFSSVTPADDETAPPDHLFGRRTEVMTLALIAALRARGTFPRIAREWFYGDPPATPLGEQEAAFYAGSAA